MYDIIFSDYDFTLYAPSKYTKIAISDKTKNSIKKYIHEGGKFVISTGRIFRSIRPVGLDLGLTDEIISSQGSQIHNLKTGENVLTRFVDKQKTVEILEMARKNGYLAQCYAGNNIYADQNYRFNVFFRKFFGVRVHASKTLLEDVQNEKINPNKFEICVSVKEINDVVKDLSSKYPEFLFSKSAPFMIEIVDKNATKGTAVSYLLDKYKIDKSKALAIGDGNNDIDMLKAVEGRACVSNATPRLKEVADYICKDKKGNGVSEVIELLLQGKSIK